MIGQLISDSELENSLRQDVLGAKYALSIWTRELDKCDLYLMGVVDKAPWQQKKEWVQENIAKVFERIKAAEEAMEIFLQTGQYIETWDVVNEKRLEWGTEQKGVKNIN